MPIPVSDMNGFPKTGEPVLKNVKGEVEIDRLTLKSINPKFSSGFLKVTTGSGNISSDTSTYLTSNLNASIYGNNSYGIYSLAGFQLGSSTTAGYVLTADASGYGSWQPATMEMTFSSDVDACCYDIFNLGELSYGYYQPIAIFSQGYDLGTVIGYQDCFLGSQGSPYIGIGAGNTFYDYSYVVGIANCVSCSTNVFGCGNTAASLSNAFGNCNYMASDYEDAYGSWNCLCGCGTYAYGSYNWAYGSATSFYGNSNFSGYDCVFIVGCGISAAACYEMSFGYYNYMQ